MEVVFGGYVEVGRIFFDKGCDVNVFFVFFFRDIVLIIVVDKGYYKFCDLLLLRGVMVDVKNKKGNLLFWLVVNGRDMYMLLMVVIIFLINECLIVCIMIFC